MRLVDEKMKAIKNFEKRIFSISSAGDFNELAMEVFGFQYFHNAIYQEYCNALNRIPRTVSGIGDIPFMPVEMFRNHRVVSFEGRADVVFASSGTTGHESSRHHVKSLYLYEQSILHGFRRFYEDPAQYCILALLPSYLERNDSSLVYMARTLIEQSRHPDSDFYLYDYERLSGTVKRLTDYGEQIMLLGVSFALLDLAEHHPTKMKNAIVIETGGMKGRRHEMVREELHKQLKAAFGLDAIHSEYGMTELLSQAYSKGSGLFACPPWMKVMIRDSNDPLQITEGKRAGGINVIDLANVYSCSFLATQDLGKMHPGGLFEVLGRFDNSDVRGCNLMVV